MRDEQIMLLKDKFGIVTGAAGGMGRAAVALFAREGAGILCADIDGGGAANAEKYVVRLSGEERERLETLIRKGKSPARRVLKARILFTPTDGLYKTAVASSHNKITKI